MKSKLFFGIALAAIMVIANSAQTARAQEEPIAGGYGTASVSRKDVKRAANFAVKSRNASTHKGFSLVSIRNAEIQVVAGLNYRVCLLVRDGRGRMSTVTAVVFKSLRARLSLSRWRSGGCTDL